MSEMAARSCSGKKRHRSELRAMAIAKATQTSAGEPMKHYECEFCHGWHVGSVGKRPEGEARTSREARKQKYANFDRQDKIRFRRVKA